MLQAIWSCDDGCIVQVSLGSGNGFPVFSRWILCGRWNILCKSVTVGTMHLTEAPHLTSHKLAWRHGKARSLSSLSQFLPYIRSIAPVQFQEDWFLFHEAIYSKNWYITSLVKKQRLRRLQAASLWSIEQWIAWKASSSESKHFIFCRKVGLKQQQIAMILSFLSAVPVEENGFGMHRSVLRPEKYTTKCPWHSSKRLSAPFSSQNGSEPVFLILPKSQYSRRTIRLQWAASTSVA